MPKPTNPPVRYNHDVMLPPTSTISRNLPLYCELCPAIFIPERGRLRRYTEARYQAQNFLEELPIFFRLDVDRVEKSRAVDEHHPYTPVQRVAICEHAHVKRCKLHQPFLSSHNTHYLYSRKTPSRLRTSSHINFADRFLKANF